MGKNGKDHKRKTLLSKITFIDVVFLMVTLSIIVAFFVAVCSIGGLR